MSCPGDPLHAPRVCRSPAPLQRGLAWPDPRAPAAAFVGHWLAAGCQSSRWPQTLPFCVSNPSRFMLSLEQGSTQHILLSRRGRNGCEPFVFGEDCCPGAQRWKWSPVGSRTRRGVWAVPSGKDHPIVSRVTKPSPVLVKVLPTCYGFWVSTVVTDLKAKIRKVCGPCSGTWDRVSSLGTFAPSCPWWSRRWVGLCLNFPGSRGWRSHPRVDCRLGGGLACSSGPTALGGDSFSGLCLAHSRIKRKV